jgi:hypothetical protein
LTGNTRRFDGTWVGTHVCSDIDQTRDIVGRVTNGASRAQVGVEGKPSSEKFEGMIEPDGTGEILHSGLTGELESDP